MILFVMLKIKYQALQIKMAVSYQASSVYFIVRFLVPLRMVRMFFFVLRVLFEKYIVAVHFVIPKFYSIRGDRRLVINSK
jgi:hypothetical protein